MIQNEASCSAAVSPGHIVEFTGTTQVRKQATAKKKTLLRIVTCNLFLGGDKDTAYAAGDNVYFSSLKPGDQAQVRIPAAAAAIVRGDQLELSGDGTMRKLTDGAALAEATEAVDNSAGGTEAFINIEVI